LKRHSEDFDAQPLSEGHGIGSGARRQGNQKLVHAGAAKQIVAAQQRAGARNHLA
jgi:hypothetical protein